MTIYDYKTAGGKNVITEYIDGLPKAERLELYDIRNEIEESGLDAFEKLNTRQLSGKKGKAEKQELEKALKRAKREGLIK